MKLFMRPVYAVRRECKVCGYIDDVGVAFDGRFGGCCPNHVCRAPMDEEFVAEVNAELERLAARTMPPRPVPDSIDPYPCRVCARKEASHENGVCRSCREQLQREQQESWTR